VPLPAANPRGVIQARELPVKHAKKKRPRDCCLGLVREPSLPDLASGDSSEG
jgi:hypothetical protein